MGQPYTSGTWMAKPGKEDEFVAAWRAMAEWTAENVAGARRGTLLRDVSDPRRFLSFGPWESHEAIDAWRALPEFQDGVAKMRELLEDFTPGTFEVIAEVG